MFSGIVEAIGEVVAIRKESDNIHFDISCPFTGELRVDQSIAHNGACLTVVARHAAHYTVTAIAETISKTNLSDWTTGTLVNLERCTKLGERLDGHLVQGHIDTVAVCTQKLDQRGSWKFSFVYEKKPNHLTVEKGSVCINGVSLTVVDSGDDFFSVCIIPYTMEHTNFKTLKEGDKVNVEFDIVGKYIAKLIQQ